MVVAVDLIERHSIGRPQVMFLRQGEIPDMERQREVDRQGCAEVQPQGSGIVAGNCAGRHAHGKPKRLLDAGGER